MWEIHMLGLTRRGLETGFREPRQSSTLLFEWAFTDIIRVTIGQTSSYLKIKLD